MGTSASSSSSSSRAAVSNPRSPNSQYQSQPQYWQEADPKKKQGITESQSLQTQIALNEVAAAQSRLNMELGAELDRANKDFFTSQDLRMTRGVGAETRLTMGEQGTQQRATIGATGAEERQTIGKRGTEERLSIGTRGEQERLSLGTRGEQERLSIGTRGTEERATIGTQAEEGRKTLLQEQMENRYIAQRGHDWAKQAYKA